MVHSLFTEKCTEASNRYRPKNLPIKMKGVTSCHRLENEWKSAFCNFKMFILRLVVRVRTMCDLDKMKYNDNKINDNCKFQ